MLSHSLFLSFSLSLSFSQPAIHLLIRLLPILSSFVSFAFPSHCTGYALCRRPPTIAHCSSIADSWQCCKRILAFWYTSLSFRMIGSVTLLSWGILGLFWDARKHNNGHLEVQPGFLPRCGGFC